MEAQRQLSLALTAARMGTFSWNVKTGSLDWTDNLEEIHGMAPGTFRGTYESFLGAVHPEDRGMVDAGVQQAVAEGSTYDVEFRVPSPMAARAGWPGTARSTWTRRAIRRA